jgi:hypothetical protein
MIGSIVAKLREMMRALEPNDSEDILIVKGPDGWHARLRDQQQTTPGNADAQADAASSTFPCKIVSKDGAFYNVTKYENGIDSASTGTAQVYILGLNFADTLPADTWIVANESQIGTTGGGNVP